MEYMQERIEKAAQYYPPSPLLFTKEWINKGLKEGYIKEEPMKYEYSQPNNCIYYEHGCCTRLSLKFYECPATMRWNDDNSNNLLCDFAGYETKESIKDIKGENK